MNRVQILQDFDKHASEFNFPMFDNAYVEYAAARLSAFQGVRDWLIVFEVLGFSTREGEFVDDVYAYGSSCTGNQGFIAAEIPLSSSPDLPLFDAETNGCIADWSRWSIKLGDQEMSFSPSREDYSRAGIALDRAPGRATLREIELLRFLVHSLGKDRFFMRDARLLSHFPKCKDLKKFVQTTEWKHPDIANEERLSENIPIRTLVEALVNRNPSLFKQGIPNTHWSCWLAATEAPDD
jgi:hypothetical protein